METLFYVTWSFIALHFTIRSLIHFELIFVKGVRSVSRFFFFFCPIVQHHFWEDYPLLNCLCSFVKDQLTVFVQVYFWAHYSVPLIYLSVLLPIAPWLDYWWFMVKCWSQEVSVLQLCSSSVLCWLFWAFLHFHVNFKIGSLREFPGGPVVRTLCSHSQGLGFHPWLGN